MQDELNITGGGIYCYMPYERLDKFKKAVFKIGLAIDFRSRTEQYNTYFPQGVYMVAFLIDPLIPKRLRGKKDVTKKSYYLTIEKFVLNYIDTHGGKRILSSTRIKNINEDG